MSIPSRHSKIVPREIWCEMKKKFGQFDPSHEKLEHFKANDWALTKNYQKIFFREIGKLVHKKKLEGLPVKIALKFRKNLLFFKF